MRGTFLRRARAVSAVTMSLVLLLATAGATSATAGTGTKAYPFGSDIDDPCNTAVTSQCVANNGTHWIERYYLESQQYSAMDWPRGTIYTLSQVGVDTKFCTASCDVRATDAYYGLNSYWAWTVCDEYATYEGNAATHDGWCFPQILVFNLSYKASKYDTLSETQAVACHEVGHTLGLRHPKDSGSTSCMVSGQASQRYLVQTQKDQLKNQY